MSGRRDDFPAGVKQVLAARAGWRCSKPDCRALTVGPADGVSRAVTNIGVAAHVTAASSGGPRFDPDLTGEQRAAVGNGIWLCQTHAKLVDDNPGHYSVEILRAWKRDVEADAFAILGRPISAQALDVLLSVSLQRAADDSLLATGTTNLPEGTRVWVQLAHPGEPACIGHVSTAVTGGMFAAVGFTDHGNPHPVAWYTVEIVAYFNQSWAQSDAVLAVVGCDGAHLGGRFAEPVDSDFDDQGRCVQARFECLAPPLTSESAVNIASTGDALEVLRSTVMTVDGSRSDDSVGAVVDWFMSMPGLREREGWKAEARPNGLVAVSYSYWDGDTPAEANWLVVPSAGQVRYADIHAKRFSWSPDY